jgi:hypothetical protein
MRAGQPITPQEFDELSDEELERLVPKRYREFFPARTAAPTASSTCTTARPTASTAAACWTSDPARAVVIRPPARALQRRAIEIDHAPASVAGGSWGVQRTEAALSSIPMTAPATPAPASTGNLVRRFGLLAAVAVLLAVLLLPAQAGLPRSGQVMLGILAFAVIVWMTEALDYAVSAVVIAALMVFLLAFVPDAAKPAAGAMGTGAALTLALSGFLQQRRDAGGSGPVHRRGHDGHGPGPAHRAARAHAHEAPAGQHRGRRHGGGLPAGVHRPERDGPGRLPDADHDRVHPRLRRRAAQPLRGAAGDHGGADGQHLEHRHQDRRGAEHGGDRFLEKQLGAGITWTDWFVAGAPYSALLTIALYFIMTRMLKPEVQEIAGGTAAIREQLAALGPMSGAQWKLLVLVLALLAFWSTEGVLHGFDTTSTTVAAIA